jgi:hypothetical protein
MTAEHPSTTHISCARVESEESSNSRKKTATATTPIALSLLSLLPSFLCKKKKQNRAFPPHNFFEFRIVPAVFVFLKKQLVSQQAVVRPLKKAVKSKKRNLSPSLPPKIVKIDVAAAAQASQQSPKNNGRSS